MSRYSEEMKNLTPAQKKRVAETLSNMMGMPQKKKSVQKKAAPKKK